MSSGMGNCCDKCGRDSVNDLCNNCLQRLHKFNKRTEEVWMGHPMDAEIDEKLRRMHGSARTPDMMATMAYGAPSVPYEPPFTLPAPPYEIAPPGREIAPVDWAKVFAHLPQKKTLRISTMREDTGALKLKVYVDNELVYEAISEHGTTLTVETKV